MSPRHKQSDPASIKSQVIRLRVTEAEAEQFKANAINAGCKSVSEFIRLRCIQSDIDEEGSNSSVDKTAVKKKK